MQRARAILTRARVGPGQHASSQECSGPLFLWWEISMPETVKAIVSVYVRLQNRQALMELREHRLRLRKSLEGKTGGYLDVSKLIRTCDEEIEIVDAGLGSLQI
jgi:hypothetical protein